MKKRHEEGFMSMTEAARELRTTRPTLLRMVRRGEIESFASIMDRRYRFVRVEDVRRLKSRAIEVHVP